MPDQTKPKREYRELAIDITTAATAGAKLAYIGNLVGITISDPASIISAMKAESHVRQQAITRTFSPANAQKEGVLQLTIDVPNQKLLIEGTGKIHTKLQANNIARLWLRFETGEVVQSMPAPAARTISRAKPPRGKTPWMLYAMLLLGVVALILLAAIVFGIVPLP